GQPDGSSHMGAWGGWALAPNTALGRDNRSHMHWSPLDPGSFKAAATFFNLLRRRFCDANLAPSRLGGLANRRFLPHPGRSLRRQRPNRRDFARFRGVLLGCLRRRLGRGRDRRGLRRIDSFERGKGVGLTGTKEIITSWGNQIARGAHQRRAQILPPHSRHWLHPPTRP